MHLPLLENKLGTSSSLTSILSAARVLIKAPPECVIIVTLFVLHREPLRHSRMPSDRHVHSLANATTVELVINPPRQLFVPRIQVSSRCHSLDSFKATNLWIHRRGFLQLCAAVHVAKHFSSTVDVWELLSYAFNVKARSGFSIDASRSDAKKSWAIKSASGSKRWCLMIRGLSDR